MAASCVSPNRAVTSSQVLRFMQAYLNNVNELALEVVVMPFILRGSFVFVCFCIRHQLE